MINKLENNQTEPVPQYPLLASSSILNLIALIVSLAGHKFNPLIFMKNFDLRDDPGYRYLISMVVDGLPEHYYKTELLLFTLGQFAQVPAANVLVQCVDRVDAAFVRFVQESGHRTRTIAPYLDGAYCNKLQQLEGLEDELELVDGLFLLNVDMVVLGRLEPPTMDAVGGKIVDGPNPPLPVLERIFAAAGVKPPDCIPCDWGTGPTVATNWNGGFLYVPAQLAAVVSTQWRRWGQWLFERPDLFDHPRQRGHTDQIAMALTLAAGSMPRAPIPANLNFPTHANRMPGTFNPADPVRVLHYHQGLDAFGLIQPALKGCAAVDEAVEQANAAIAARRVFRFFDGYKRDRAMKASNGVIRTQKRVRSLLRETGVLDGNRRRLILHAGTPKPAPLRCNTAWSRTGTGCAPRALCIRAPTAPSNRASINGWSGVCARPTRSSSANICGPISRPSMREPTLFFFPTKVCSTTGGIFHRRRNPCWHRWRRGSKWKSGFGLETWNPLPTVTTGKIWPIHALNEFGVRAGFVVRREDGTIPGSPSIWTTWVLSVRRKRIFGESAVRPMRYAGNIVQDGWNLVGDWRFAPRPGSAGKHRVWPSGGGFDPTD